jgi:hypothetical protein
MQRRDHSGTPTVPLRSGKRNGHGFTGWRDGGRDNALDEHRFS